MNQYEYRHNRKANQKYHKIVLKKLEEWKNENHIKESCVIHHRNDTDECVEYNSKHYEYFGCNLDGSFEYGKYVVFMTRSYHAKYHHTGRVHTEESRKHMSEGQKGHSGTMTGKHHSDETKKKMHDAAIGKAKSEVHKQHVSEGLKKYFSENEITDETRKKLSESISASWTEERKEKYRERYKNGKHPLKGFKMTDESKAKMSAAWTDDRRKRQQDIAHGRSLLWHTYNSNGGMLNYKDFNNALKIGDITFNDYKISVFL